MINKERWTRERSIAIAWLMPACPAVGLALAASRILSIDWQPDGMAQVGIGVESRSVRAILQENCGGWLAGEMPGPLDLAFKVALGEWPAFRFVVATSGAA